MKLPKHFGERKNKKTFKCRRCGKCCHTPTPFLTLKDYADWTDAGISPLEMREKMTLAYLTENGVPVTDLFFSFREDENGNCVMLEDGKCSFYEHRPLVCKLFPIIVTGVGSTEASLKTRIKEVKNVSLKIHGDVYEFRCNEGFAERVEKHTYWTLRKGFAALSDMTRKADKSAIKKLKADGKIPPGATF